MPANQIPFSFIDWSKNWKLLLRDFFLLVMDPIEGRFFNFGNEIFKGSETRWKTIVWNILGIEFKGSETRWKTIFQNILGIEFKGSETRWKTIFQNILGIDFKGSETRWKTEKKFVWGEHHSKRKSNRFS